MGQSQHDGHQSEGVGKTARRVEQEVELSQSENGQRPPSGRAVSRLNGAAEDREGGHDGQQEEDAAQDLHEELVVRVEPRGEGTRDEGDSERPEEGAVDDT